MHTKFAPLGIGLESIWCEVNFQIHLGGDQFVERKQSSIEKDLGLSGMPEIQSARPAKFIAEVPNQENDRNQVIAIACQNGGAALDKMMAFFNLHYSTVCIIVRKSKT